MPPAMRPALQLLGAQLGGDRLRRRLGERQRQRAVAQLVGQRGRRLLVELTGDRRPAVDGALDRRRRDDAAVEGERDVLLDVPRGVLGPLRPALGLEVEQDDPRTGRLIGAGGGVVDLRALDDRGPEQVLGGAVLGTGGDVAGGQRHLGGRRPGRRSASRSPRRPPPGWPASRPARAARSSRWPRRGPRRGGWRTADVGSPRRARRCRARRRRRRGVGRPSADPRARVRRRGGRLAAR